MPVTRLSEINSNDVCLSCDKMSNESINKKNLSNDCPIKETEELSFFALSFFNKYPWQNLRGLRPLLEIDSVNPKKEILASKLKEAKIGASLAMELAEIHNNIVKKRAEILSIPFSCNFEIEKIREASNFFNLLLWAYEKSNPQPVFITYSIPNLETSLYSVRIDPKYNALVMANKLFSTPETGIITKSTITAQIKDIPESRWIKTILSHWPEKTPSNVRIFNYYLDVFDRPKVNVPGLDAFRIYLEKLYGKDIVEKPHKIWIADWEATASRGAVASYDLGFDYADRYIDLDEHEGIFQLLAAHRKTYEKAVAIMCSHHSYLLNKANPLTLLEDKTFKELFWATQEDPWQDYGAAKKYGSSLKEKYEKKYNEYIESKGTVFGYNYEGKIYDLPWTLAAWKVPIEQQGIGPNQIIIGSLLEAGKYANGTLWKDYFPGKTLDIKNAVQIALDLDQSILAIGMIHDYCFYKLEKGAFNNPLMRLPEGIYPTISNPLEAREFFMFSVCKFFNAWPEASKNFPDVFPFAHKSWDIDFTTGYFQLLQQILGLGEGFPSLKMKFIPSNNFTKMDWFALKQDQSDESSLLLVTIPQ